MLYFEEINEYGSGWGNNHHNNHLDSGTKQKTLGKHWLNAVKRIKAANYYQRCYADTY